MKVKVICEAGVDSPIPEDYCGKTTQILDCGNDFASDLRKRLHEAMVDAMRSSYEGCPIHGHEALAVFPCEETDETQGAA